MISSLPTAYYRWPKKIIGHSFESNIQDNYYRFKSQLKGKFTAVAVSFNELSTAENNNK